jgi:Domain of unknown function (DUF4136)
VKKLLRTTLAIPAVLIAVSCASTTTSVNSDPAADFSRYRTFRIDASRMETGSARYVQKEVQTRLEAKGLREAGETADLDVVARVIRGPQDTGRETGYQWWSGGAVTAATGGSPEGTLVVDLIERARNQLVWRGEARGTIPAAAAGREDKVRRVLDKLFADYPPKRKSG